MSLKPNQLGFIEVMTKGAEAEQDGFAILAKRPDAALFFDKLLDAGLLAASKIQGPVPAEREGYFRLPYWNGLDYLEAIAKQSADSNDIPLGKKVADIILSISRDATDDQRQNYHVWRKFADTIALLPLPVLSQALILEVRQWLSTRLDRSLAAESLGNKLMPKLIVADDQAIRRWALELFGILTGLKDSAPGAEARIETEVEGYWVNEIVKRNLAAFIAKEPRATADLFRERVKQVFSGSRGRSSWLYRPAVEEHSQNMDWHAAENFSVAGLRDILSEWLRGSQADVQSYLGDLFRNGGEMERRIAIAVFDKHFDQLKDLSPVFLTPALIDVATLHESYNFLRHHGDELDAVDANRILDAIAQINLPIDGEEDEGRNERLKLRWLSALASAGVQPAIPLYDGLVAKYGHEGDRPDFLSYHETSTGPGPSPYTKAELLAFLLDGTLFSKLNAFEEQRSWRGPTMRALCDTLEEAVVENAQAFLAVRKGFLSAKRGFQYAYLSGYLRQWASEKTAPTKLDWPAIWHVLIDWTAAVIDSDGFWAEPIDETIMMSPNRNWLVNQFAELVEAATRDDSHAAPEDALPKLRQIVVRLMAHIPPEPLKSSDGAVNHVINTQRGKAVEALVNYALRRVRLAEKSGAGRQTVWEPDLQPLFDAEVARIPTGNPEFVVLFGQFLSQLQYMNVDWLDRNIDVVFRESTFDFELALAGTAYAQNNRPLYRMLVKHGIVERGLALPDTDGGGRERLVERVAIAILWEEEALGGALVSSIFQKGQLDDISKMASIYWQSRREGLSEKQIAIVQAFWRMTADWAAPNETAAKRLSPKLLSLLTYFDTLDGPDQVRVMAMLKFTNTEDHTWFIAEEFDRLAVTHPEFVGKAIKSYVEVAKPFYDHDNHLLNATRTVWKAHFPELAMEIANSLRNLPAFKALFLEMRGS